MKTSKLVGLALLVLGGVLIYFGINAIESPLEELKETVTGSYTDQTMYYLIGGGISIVVGLGFIFKR